MHWIRHFLWIITPLHRAVFRYTGGRVGSRLPGLHFLLLVHRGRKSGIERETPLLYVPDDKRFLVLASNAGQDHDPAWWLNLQANPEAKVRVGRRVVAVAARRAEGDEAQQLWPQLLAAFPAFEGYRQGTEREIPIVVLEPRSAGA